MHPPSDAGDARGRAPRRPSLRPALLVVALALAILVAGGALALVTSSNGRSSGGSALSGTSTALPGTAVRAESARSLIAHIASAGEPPGNIVAGLEVPVGSRYLSTRVNDRGVSQFDKTVELSAPDPERALRRFFLALLSQRRWVVTSISTPARGAVEILAKKGGDDGYEWNVGIEVRPVHTLVSPALSGSDRSPSSSHVSIELYQVGNFG